MRLLLTAMIFGVFAFAATDAQACGGNSPAGVEGEIIFNETTNVPQYCDGDNWIAMKGGEPPAFNPMQSNCTATVGTLNLTEAGVYSGSTANDYLGLWADGNYIFAANGWRGSGGGPLNVYEFNGTNLTEVATSSQMLNFAEGIWKSGNYIFIGSPGSSGDANAGLHVFSWNGSTLTHLDSNNTDVYQARQMTGDGQYIYVASGDNGVHAFTFDGTSLTKVGDSIPDTGASFSHGAFAHGGYIYLAQGGAGLQVATFNGTNWNVIDTDTTATSPVRVWHDGRYVYAAVNEGLAAYSFNGTSLTHITNYTLTASGRNVWGDGKHIYVTENGGDNTFSALTFNGSTFTLVDSIVLDGGNGPRGITGNGTYLFVGEENGDLHALSGFACANSSVTTNSVQVVANGLAAHWRFDETSGSVVGDSIGRTSNGSFYGGMTSTGSTAAGKFGTSFDFSGSNNHEIQVPPTSAINNIFHDGGTISFWIYPLTANTGDIIFKTSNAGTLPEGYILRFWDNSSGRLLFRYAWATGRHEWRTNDIVNFNQWNHIAVVFNSSADTNEPTIYVNDIPATTSLYYDIGGGGAPPSDAAQTLWLGYRVNGSLDDVRYYGRELGSSEISQIYNATSADTTGGTSTATQIVPNGLVGHWRLDETSGTTAFDSSGNGNHGAIMGQTGVAGNVVHSLPSPVGTFIQFADTPPDGSGLRVETPSPVLPIASPGIFSFTAWVKRNRATQSIFRLGTRSIDDFTFFRNLRINGSIMGFQDINSFDMSTNDEWEHLSITYNGTTLTTYINGSVIDSRNVPIDITDGRILFGGGLGSWGEGGADFDDVRLYNRPLTAAEVQQIYEARDGIRYNSTSRT